MCDTARISGAIPAMVGPKTPAGDYKYGGSGLQWRGAWKAMTDCADF